MIRWNIWTLDVDCNPAGKRSWRFCGRRLNTSKSQIRLFMKNLVLKISRHQRNTQPWKNFHNWPGFITTFTKLSSHYGWSQNHKAEQTLQLITTFTKLSSRYGWYKTTSLSSHYSWYHKHKSEQSLRLITTRTRLSSHYCFLTLQVHLTVQEPTGETAKWGPGWSRRSEGPPPRETRIRHN